MNVNITRRFVFLFNFSVINVHVFCVLNRPADVLPTNLHGDEEKRESVVRQEPVKTHREGVRMNSTALKREIHIKNKLKGIKK